MFEGFSEKQIEVIQEGYAPLTILTGGVRGGKTFLTYFFMPELIAMFPNKKGILIGKTLASLTENVLTPMREIYGGDLVSEIHTGQDGIKFAWVFGKKVRCVGANDVKAENKIRGATYVWAIGDEVSTWSKSTFDMLMSRLSEEGAICVCTTNPDEPTHWFNVNYIQKDGIAKKVFKFTIDDNPYLSKDFVENLKNIYSGTELFDRLILGEWASGSGAIYKRFITEPDKFIIEDDAVTPNDFIDYSIGIDFGENKSATHFTLLGLRHNANGIVVLEEEHIKEHKDTALLQSQFLAFLAKCKSNGWRLNNSYYDCAQKTLGESLKAVCAKNGIATLVKPCTKDHINERVNQELVLFGAYMLQIRKSCKWAIRAFKEAVYDDNGERLDVVSDKNPVDTLDTIEYAFREWIKVLIQKALYR